MKKLILIFAVICMIFSMSACGQEQVTYSQSKPYWLPEESFGNTVDKSASEVCVYDVTLSPSETPNEYISLDLYDSTYKTELSYALYNETDCYLLTTTHNINGKYVVTLDGEEVESYEFNDEVVSKSYFTWNNGVNVKFSEQVARSTSPLNATGVKDKYNNRFATISYKTTTTYGEKDATTTFEMIGTEEEKTAMTPYFALSDGFNGTIKNYAKTNYIDINVLYFVARAFDFSVDLRYSFSSISVLENKKHSLLFSTKEAVSIPVSDLIFNNTPVPSNNPLPSYSLEFGLNETYEGQTIICKYFQDTVTWRHFMYQMITPLSYNTGTLTYTLKNVTSSK